jgi:hypothetical protein
MAFFLILLEEYAVGSFFGLKSSYHPINLHQKCSSFPFDRAQLTDGKVKRKSNKLLLLVIKSK